MSKLEELPNEILRMICDYIPSRNLLKAVCKLSKRFCTFENYLSDGRVFPLTKKQKKQFALKWKRIPRPPSRFGQSCFYGDVIGTKYSYKYIGFDIPTLFMNMAHECPCVALAKEKQQEYVSQCRCTKFANLPEIFEFIRDGYVGTCERILFYY